MIGLVWIAAALGADGVELTPQLPEGRAIHWTVEQAFDTGDTHTGRTVWEVLEVLPDGEVRLFVTARAANPLPVVSLLWPEIVSTSESVLTPGQPGAPAPDAPPITAEDAAFGSCNALPGLWVSLPEGPVRVGASWEIGAVTCTLTTVRGTVATVKCEGSRPREAPMVSETVSRSLTFDTEAGLVTTCEAELSHELMPADNSWSVTERAEGELGEPDDGSSGCNGVAVGGVVGGVIALVLVGWQRRRSMS